MPVHVRSGVKSQFETDNPGSLADYAVRLFAPDLSMVGARARTHAEAAHDLNVVFGRLFHGYHDVYRDVLAR